ncbi:DUF3131 domain-containing protein [Ramlibacter humi]|uniref:DUF3131 domain-containing protein n=1 Tax=Ramlibacter humi TaxID=2530451 RepID=A0A4Z0BD53_9BURK|nr:DUF3131 domain-containing protein [Ramlibacter humi]TFY96710.1 DUF3131 domain-containing protein [Ramlibacter humi]
MALRPRLLAASLALACAGLALAQQPAAPQPRASEPALGQANCRPGELAAARYERRFGALTEGEMAMARTAWKYFENNTQPSGLANAVDNYPSTTMWDTGSYLGAVVAARELKLITPQQADERLSRAIAALGGLAFFRDELPNKVYNTRTLEKVDYGNKPGEIGYSALDLGRLLVWLKIVKERYPQHADAVDRFVLRWKWGKVVDAGGMMFGALVDKGQVQYVQEGRLGYEEYAAKGFQLWGVNTDLASKPEPYATAPIYCVEVPYDSRDPRKYYQHNYVVTESYALDGIEFNWDLADDRGTDDRQHTHTWMADFANRVYQAQENRWKATGILTARSEHQLDAEPYFVYDTVFTDGYPWNTITESGQYVPQFAAVSLKAALGMWVLWRSDYTDKLFAEVAKNGDPQRGFMEGVLESGKGPIRAFTANNNGIMLETLLFKAQGKLLKWGAARESQWDKQRCARLAAGGSKGPGC